MDKIKDGEQKLPVALQVVVGLCVMGLIAFVLSRPGNNARNAPERQMWGAPPCLYGTWRLVGRSDGFAIPARKQTVTFHTKAISIWRDGDKTKTVPCRVELVSTSLAPEPVPVVTEDNEDAGFIVARCDATHLTLDKMNVTTGGYQYEYEREGSAPVACK